MLVLTRKIGEEIAIGKEVVVRVIETGKTRVRVGIEAPADVIVIRRELQDGQEGPPAAA